MVGVIMLGFVVQAAGVSALSHTRTQATLYDQYRHSLADATAPVGQVDAEGALYPLGTPMAILSIPSIGVKEVVVEGTTSAALLAGPGHRRDSVLPGQSGTSVIMGRQGAYGGPFSRLHELAVGDAISATTGQGTSTYRVVGIRDTATSPAAVDGAGRLTLVTAGGDPWLPEGILRIDAELISTPYATPQRALLVGSLTAAEEAMAPDPSAGLPLLLSLEFAVVAVWACAVGRRRWGRWHVWVAAAPVLLVAGALVATQTVILLPNLF
ncbi:sortase [Microbacterium fluvii]